MIRLAFATASLTILAACATTTPEPEATAPEPALEVVEPAAIADNPFALGMNTVETLVEGGNEQLAIDRLTQLLGDSTLSDDERAMVRFERARLRYGEGNDVFGAIEDLDILLESPGVSMEMELEATEMRDIARGEATSLNFMLGNGNLSRTEQFETMFRLGDHQGAVDYMLDNALTPENAYLIDLYQMGFLCEGAEYGGPTYPAVDPNGTERALQFCDFGK